MVPAARRAAELCSSVGATWSSGVSEQVTPLLATLLKFDEHSKLS